MAKQPKYVHQSLAQAVRAAAAGEGLVVTSPKDLKDASKTMVACESLIFAALKLTPNKVKGMRV